MEVFPHPVIDQVCMLALDLRNGLTNNREQIDCELIGGKYRGCPNPDETKIRTSTK